MVWVRTRQGGAKWWEVDDQLLDEGFVRAHRSDRWSDHELDSSLGLDLDICYPPTNRAPPATSPASPRTPPSFALVPSL